MQGIQLKKKITWLLDFDLGSVRYSVVPLVPILHLSIEKGSKKNNY